MAYQKAVPGFWELVEQEERARNERLTKPREPRAFCKRGHKHLNARFAAVCDAKIEVAGDED